MMMYNTLLNFMISHWNEIGTILMMALSVLSHTRESRANLEEARKAAIF